MSSSASAPSLPTTPPPLPPPSIFFTIPPEIRLKIYAHVLHKDHPIILHAGRGEIHPRVRNQTVAIPKRCPLSTVEEAVSLLRSYDPTSASTPSSSKPPHTSLLLVSRLINHEATPVLCSSNLIVVPSATTLLTVLSGQQFSLLANLRHVALFFKFRISWPLVHGVNLWPVALHSLMDEAPALRSVGLYFENTGDRDEVQMLRRCCGLDGDWNEQWMQEMLEDLSSCFDLTVGYVDSPANIQQA